ncbi:MAG: Uma2 family endonuclease [Polyangiaceae bacterium]|nr:Uma2 family endonuclease [Polyangiaceae bacterium]
MSVWSPVVFARSARAEGRRLSLTEWATLPEDEPGELVDSVLTEEEMIDPVHGLCASWLIALLRAWLGGRGFVFDADMKLAVRKDRGRKADACVYLPGRPPPPRRGLLRTPPDVVVEIVTPTPRDERRDRVDKMDDYAAFGITYYWLVDPALGSFEIFELKDGRYQRALGATCGVIAHVPGCEGLVIDLDALWDELERLGPED